LNSEEAKMLKQLMITAAAAALIAGGAGAQSPAPSPTPSQETGKGQFVSQQMPDQMLASKFKGTDVIGTDNQKIGDVTDVLFDKDSKVLAYVIGVGGFLGIGSKDVALSPTSFQVQPATDKEHMKLKLAMTKDELKNAAEFKPYKEPSRTSTTGQGSPGMAPRDRAPATPQSGR
jgi:PRC-barrel domain protein